MAVNILLGAPGGGKSYEAVAFHVLPALAAGRKVITNLPLVIAEFVAIDPSYAALIELRSTTKAERPEFDAVKAQSLYQKFGIAAKQEYFNLSAFSHVEDYGDSWRHPESGSGPLYVVDECHIALPSRGTPVKVEEWFSLHRHESADVLLISQSHSKINRSVIDLVQTCYRVRKNTALGSDKSYRRFVFDGVRGAEVNFSVRKYQSHFFKLYKSHTRGGGQEQASADIVPIWKRPIFLIVALCIPFTGYMVWKAPNPIGQSVPAPGAKPDNPAPGSPGQKPQTLDPLQTKLTAASAPSPAQIVKRDSSHALESWQVHQVGTVRVGTVTRVLFRVSRNGGAFFDTDSRKLVEMGYTVTSLAACFSQISHPSGYRVHVSCDAPTQNSGLPGSAPQPGGVTGGGTREAGGYHETPNLAALRAPAPDPVLATVARSDIAKAKDYYR